MSLHGESSDDTKSECSRANTPHPPPAHQSIMSLTRHSVMAPVSSHHQTASTSLYSHQVAAPHMSPGQHSPVPLVYRPTFLSSYMQAQQGMSPPCSQSEYVPQANNESITKATRL